LSFPWRSFLARTLTWRDRIPEIRQRVENSVVETWTRRDLENVFELKRAAAQLLMRAVGEVHNLGGIRVVNRNSLLAFLDQIKQSDDPEAVRREKIPHSGVRILKGYCFTP
jgi:hypothetical protein